MYKNELSEENCLMMKWLNGILNMYLNEITKYLGLHITKYSMYCKLQLIY